MASDDERARSLLEPIFADPADTAARRVYADWLLEKGDPRGEFINVSLDLAADPSGSRANALGKRRAEMLRGHAARWIAQYGEGISADFDEGGFLWRAAMSGEVFAKEGRRLLAWEPIRELRLETVSDADAATAFSVEGMSRVTTLSVRQNPFALERLVESPHLGSLESLDLSQCGLGPAGAAVIAKWNGLARLDWLNLFLDDLQDEGAAALAAAAKLPGEVDLSANHLTDEGVQSFFASAGIGFVRRLNLGLNDDMADGAAQAIADLAPPLEKLDVRYGSLTGAGARAIAESPRLASLLELEISGCRGDANAGLTAVAAGTFRGLKDLNFDRSTTGPAGVRAISRSGFELKFLAMRDSPAIGRSAEDLLELPRMIGLRLKGSKVPGDVMEKLAKKHSIAK